jgi:N-acyl-D-aspartate/D-glutamate deacylase
MAMAFQAGFANTWFVSLDALLLNGAEPVTRDSSLCVWAMQQKAWVGLSRRIFLNRLRPRWARGAMMATARKSILGKAAVMALLLLAGAADSQAQPAAQVDLLIKNGHVVDGTGGPWFQADVAITGDRIVYVGRAPVKAKRVIDAGGKVISPGFIDMHSHSEFGLSLDGRALSKITQGITTEVMGEHLSAGPVLGPAVDDPMMVTPPVKRSWTTLGGFFSYLQNKGIGLNVASYVGAGQVRASVMGYQNRQPTPAEMERMKQLIRQGMEEGAFGLSNGMSYVPNMFFDTAQLIELCKVAGGYGGIFTIHIRNVAPGDPRDKGLKEAIAIAKGAHIPAEIFHLGASAGMDPDDFIRDVQQARADGVDITGNSYPYETGWTYLTQSLPAWAQEGDSKAIVARLQAPDSRTRILTEMKDRDFSNLKVASVNPDFDGKPLPRIAAEMHVSPAEALLNILVKMKGEGFQIGLPTGKRAAIVTQMLNNPWMDIGSDGIALPAGVRTSFGSPHPRSFGSHTRLLAEYVRKQHVFTLEEAVRKMTSLPANRLGLVDRGVLRQGMKADVVVFDPQTVQDMASYENPAQYSQGIAWVLVNGKPVVANGKPTNALPGQVLHGPGYKPGTP